MPGFVRTVSVTRGGSRYPLSIPAIRHLGELSMHPSMTFIVGENGSGKSTLVEAIAIVSGLNAEGGSRNMRFSLRETESNLHDALEVVKHTKRPRDGYFL